MRHPLLPFLLLSCCLAAPTPGQEGQSTFGHARARELAELGRLPSARDVVVRDIVDFHRHRLPLPRSDQEVALDVRFDRAAPDASGHLVLQVGYTTRPGGDRKLTGPCALALVVDCSGSMRERGKLDEVRRGLHELARHLRPDDEVALVSFANEDELLAGRRRLGDGDWLHTAIDRLEAGGSTNLHAGLLRGLRELPPGDDGDRPRRVVLLTDGIANRGVTEPQRILDDVRPFTTQGIDVSTIGVGQDLDVALLERLAAGTRGLFHFVADEQQVQKVFVAEIDSLLQPAVRKPRLTVELPEELAVERVYHEGVEQRNGRLVVDLRDLNAGATGVLLVRLRAGTAARGDLRVRAELAWRSADTGRPASVAAEATARTDERADDRRAGPVDVEVQRNLAIAVLAQGMADMAAACDERRWAEADRALRLAQDEAQRLFPGDDADVQRVRDIAAGHARTLRGYVDRFRDY